MTAEALRRHLEALGVEYRRGLPAKIAAIESLWRQVASGGAAPERRAELERELHTLAGTARTFGIAGVSEAAAAAEDFLARRIRKAAAVRPAAQLEFQRLLDALRQSVPAS